MGKLLEDGIYEGEITAFATPELMKTRSGSYTKMTVKIDGEDYFTYFCGNMDTVHFLYGGQSYYQGKKAKFKIEQREFTGQKQNSLEFRGFI